MDIKNLSIEELQKISKDISAELLARRDKRQKELWGNVKSALLKYVEECGNIEIIADDCDSTLITKDSFDTPNKIYLTY